MEYIDRTDYGKPNMQYKWEHGMYELSPAPPQMEWQEYIDLYFAEKDSKYFTWFLHYYERIINSIANKAAEKHNMTTHLTGIKSAIVFGLFEALLQYDPENGVEFLAFQKSFVTKQIDEYTRTMQSGVITMTVDTYPILKKIMALFRQNGNKCDDDSIQKICQEVNMQEKTIRKYIRIGLLNESRTDLDGKTDKDGNRIDYSTDDLISDQSSQPDKLYFRTEQNEAISKAYDKLKYREQLMVAARLGFCPKCFGIRHRVTDENGNKVEVSFKKQPFFDIALSHSLSSAEAAENIYYGALEKMRKWI